MNLTYGSVCSGIEAASVAWEPLGFRPAWFAEVDKAASDVLAYRFPKVENLGDMTTIPGLLATGLIDAPDILVGGTPCQAFSIAGRREGLADARGQLTLAYVDIADELDRQRAEPCIAVWENVPGVLSQHDNAFGCFLAALAGDEEPLEPGERPADGKSNQWWSWKAKEQHHAPKWPVAGLVVGPTRTVGWIVRDAQYFGLAQRRRRVFVVASAREGFDPGAILFEFDRVRRDSPPSRETGEGVAGTLDARSTGGGFPRTDGACSGHVVPAAGSSGEGADHGSQQDTAGAVRGGAGDRGTDRLGWPAEIAPTLNAHFGTKQGLEDQHINGGAGLFVPVTAFSSKDYGADATDDISPTLRASGHDESHANGGRTPAVAYAIQERAVSENIDAGPQGKGWQPETAYTLEARNKVQSVAFVQNSRDEVRLMGGDGQIVGALAAEAGAKQQCYVASVNGCSVDGCDGSHHANGMCRAHYGRFKRYGDPLAGRTSEGEPLTFLTSHIQHRDDECLLWPYAKLKTGYGSIEFEGRTCRAHRVMCELAHGPAHQEGLDAAHRCGVRLCINPKHLRWATRSENMEDAAEHGTAPRGERHGGHKLCEDDVLEIRARLAKGHTHQSIADDFEVSRNAISDIAQGKNWAWLENATRHRTPPTVCFQTRIARNGRGYEEEISPALNGADAGATSDMRPCVAGPTMAVRRLMPIECERLQGFPDNWTRIPVRRYAKRTITKTRPEHQWEPDADGKHWWLMAADGPRYKQLGNSMAVPVMHWLGSRIKWWLTHRDTIVDLIA